MARRLTELEPVWGTGVYEREGILYSPVDPTLPESQRHLELNPHYHVASWFPRGREKMTVTFRCPVHYPQDCELSWLMVPFSNPLDGGPKTKDGQGKNRDHWWTVSGDSFENLTLTPSIKFPEDGSEHWHGHVTNGLVTP